MDYIDLELKVIELNERLFFEAERNKRLTEKLKFAYNSIELHVNHPEVRKKLLDTLKESENNNAKM